VVNSVPTKQFPGVPEAEGHQPLTGVIVKLLLFVDTLSQEEAEFWIDSLSEDFVRNNNDIFWLW
jgi:hypothetical protein